MIDDINEGKYVYRMVKFDELSHFVAMKGNRYDFQKKRLLIVGRATNGWGSLDCTSNILFREQALDEYKNNHFDWVVEQENGKLCNDVGTYSLTTEFWSASEKVFRRLNPDIQHNRWVDYIAWTNLYKVSPTYKDNPDVEMQKIQFILTLSERRSKLKLMNTIRQSMN